MTALAHVLGYPRFDQHEARPLLVLADLPFKIYLTVSITTLLEDALRKAKKQPITKMCRWRGPDEAPEKDLWRIPDNFKLDEASPLSTTSAGSTHTPRTAHPCPIRWR